MTIPKTSTNLDKVMTELLEQARREPDSELKLQMIDRVLKHEALKLKAQQGAMGSGFDDPTEGT